jgi:hypothetical protein
LKYKQQKDGDIISPYMNKPYKMKCCDCGLVHTLKFSVRKLTRRMKKGYWVGKKVSGYKVVFQAFRDERATAASRRKKRGSVKVTT